MTSPLKPLLALFSSIGPTVMTARFPWRLSDAKLDLIIRDCTLTLAFSEWGTKRWQNASRKHREAITEKLRRKGFTLD